jgi:hypothetical protein
MTFHFARAWRMSQGHDFSPGGPAALRALRAMAVDIATSAPQLCPCRRTFLQRLARQAPSPPLLPAPALEPEWTDRPIEVAGGIGRYAFMVRLQVHASARKVCVSVPGRGFTLVLRVDRGRRQAISRRSQSLLMTRTHQTRPDACSRAASAHCKASLARARAADSRARATWAC